MEAAQKRIELNSKMLSKTRMNKVQEEPKGLVPINTKPLPKKNLLEGLKWYKYIITMDGTIDIYQKLTQDYQI